MGEKSAPGGKTQNVAAAVTRTDELRKHWPLGEDFDAALYTQTDRPNVGLQWAPAILPLVLKALPANKQACVGELVGAMRELAVGSNEADHVILCDVVKPGATTSPRV
jgi:hypothetical protein